MLAKVSFPDPVPRSNSPAALLISSVQGRNSLLVHGDGWVVYTVGDS